MASIVDYLQRVKAWRYTYRVEVAKGEYPMKEFMDGIIDLVKKLVQTYSSMSDKQKTMFGSSTQEFLWKCPKCGSEVVKGKYGAYKIFLKGLKEKGSYDAYLIPEGIEDSTYTKDGK